MGKGDAGKALTEEDEDDGAEAANWVASKQLAGGKAEPTLPPPKHVFEALSETSEERAADALRASSSQDARGARRRPLCARWLPL